MSRVHIALTVSNLEESLDFYDTLFQTAASKRRPGYAKYELSNPPVHLALNEDPSSVRTAAGHDHFGVQLGSSTDVWSERKRLDDAGIATRVEEAVTCCYSVQDKFWAEDPDGYPWELFVVTQPDAGRAAPKDACCGQ